MSIRLMCNAYSSMYWPYRWYLENIYFLIIFLIHFLFCVKNISKRKRGLYFFVWMNIQLQFWFICSDCWHFHGLLLKTWLTCGKSMMFVQSLCTLSLLHTHILLSARGTLVMSASSIIWQCRQRTDPSVNTVGFITPGTRIWVRPERQPEPLVSCSTASRLWACRIYPTIRLCWHLDSCCCPLCQHRVAMIIKFLTAGLLFLDKSIVLK